MVCVVCRIWQAIEEARTGSTSALYVSSPRLFLYAEHLLRFSPCARVRGRGARPLRGVLIAPQVLFVLPDAESGAGVVLEGAAGEPWLLPTPPPPRVRGGASCVRVSACSARRRGCRLCIRAGAACSAVGGAKAAPRAIRQVCCAGGGGGATSLLQPDVHLARAGTQGWGRGGAGPDDSRCDRELVVESCVGPCLAASAVFVCSSPGHTVSFTRSYYF